MHGLDADSLRRISEKFSEVDTVELPRSAAPVARAHSSAAGQEGTGLVDLGSFCRLLRVDRSPFVERLFAMFDIDNDDLIDLKEFIVGA